MICKNCGKRMRKPILVLKYDNGSLDFCSIECCYEYLGVVMKNIRMIEKSKKVFKI